MKRIICVSIFSAITVFAVISQNIPKIRLNAIKFTPSTFTPKVCPPIDYSPSMEELQESLHKREQQQQAVGDKYVGFCKLIGDIYMMLYPDKDLYEWYNEYKKEMLSEIESNYQIGNYQTTSRLIDQRISALTKDPRLLCRIDASNKYKAFRELVSNKFSGSLTSQWWIDTHPFIYEDSYDKNGQIIGYKSTDLEPLVDDFEWLDHIIYVRDYILRGKKFTKLIGGDLYDKFSLTKDGFKKSVAQSYKVAVWYYNREFSTKSQSYDSSWKTRQQELLFNGEELISPREYYIRQLSTFLM